MYPIGSRVVYSSSGVCTVSDIRREDFTGEERDYYVLKPMDGGTSSIFVPTDNDRLTGRMRTLLTRDQALDLIRKMPHENPDWIPDNRARGQLFQEILLGCNILRLVRMMRAIYHRREELAARGKKNLMADENALKRAEKILYGEMALVFGLTPDQVPPFIAEKIEENLAMEGA